MRPRTQRLKVAAPALLAAVLTFLSATSADVAAPAAGTTAVAAETRSVLVTGKPTAVRAAVAEVSTAEDYVALPIIGGFAADLTDRQVADLAASGLHVSDNAPVSVTDADWGADSHDASAVYPQVDGAPGAWAAGLDGRGVGVAVVDTGISNTGDLAGKVVAGHDFSGEGSPTTDSFGHGTYVAGLIAGSGAASGGAVKGVAPGVDLISLKVAGADGSSDVIRVISAIQWAVAHAAEANIRVLNLSLGTDSEQSWRIDPLNAAVEAAWRAGITVTVAAGNAGSEGIAKPGDDPYVITVGSSDDATTVDAGDDVLAPFSSTGPTVDGVAKPDLVAPGAHLVSTRASGSTVDTTFPASRVEPAYFRGSGTSFSAPQVAAAAALVLQQRPAMTNNQLKGLLTSTASPLQGVPAAAQGAGALDIRALLAAPTGPVANQRLARSDGTGSILKSQGSLVHAGGAGESSSAAWNAYLWAGAAWNGYEWHGRPWNSTAWNNAAWNSTAWNSTAWNSTAWNSTAWNSTAWNSTAWNATGWASTGFWSTAWN